MNTNSRQHFTMNNSTNASEPSGTRGIAFTIFESCVFLLMDIAALVGNFLVCLAFHRNPSLRTTTNYFVLSLALADLSMAVLIMPLNAASSIANRWATGQFGCKIIYSFSHVLAGVSLLTVMLLSVNRYFRVVQPRLYANSFSKRRSLTMVISVWIIVILIMAIVLSVTGMQFEVNTMQPNLCFLPKRDLSAFVLYGVVHSVFIFVPSLVNIMCYVQIYRAIRQHNAASTSSLSQKKKSSYGVKEAKITKTITIVVVGFYCCWLPLFITNILDSANVIGKDAEKYFSIYYSFPVYASSVINPIIYATMCQLFRKEFSKTFKFCWKHMELPSLKSYTLNPT